MREYQVRICERLGVKFPGPTRQQPSSGVFHRTKKYSFGITRLWRSPVERGAEDMIPHASGHSEIPAMG